MSAPGAGGTDALGATLHADGTRFSVLDRVADRVEVCLLDATDAEERLELEARDDGRWHADVAGVGAGQRYGLRVHGPFEPERGLWCDPTKLLMDPWARAFDGSVREPRGALAAGSGVDTAPLVPASVVVDERFEWGDDDEVRPRHPWTDTVVYEVHVRGATMRHPGVERALRGSYLGLGAEAVTSHLVDLGITTVELLPVHEFVDEGFLVDAGLTNYWGYNPIGFFAPAARYAASRVPGAQVHEFKSLVAALHRAGLEVLLDVVYNHTAEGDEAGPTLSLRGLDAPSYYRLNAEHRLVDTTGCGNSLNAASDAAIDLVVDSLRYWVTECHVDGFRFDLAPTLARPDGAFDPAAPILRRCATDPVVSSAKLVSEPWDVRCEDSYALGRFPAPFREWNGAYRDCVRDFWRGEPGGLATLATRVAGSTDLFDETSRPFPSSVNYVTSHDGFTLRDVVSYDEKHNEANGQGNDDGTEDNRSWNCGAEGETDDPDVLARRACQARALVTTLVVSHGVPMLLGGDELWRTQGGNNNAYCQDNETSWLDWDATDHGHVAFTRRALALRRAHPSLRGVGDSQLRWHGVDGAPMGEWGGQDESARCVALRASSTVPTRDDVVVLVNGHTEDVEFALPDGAVAPYVEALSSVDPERHGARHGAGDRLVVPERSVLVLIVVDEVDGDGVAVAGAQRRV